MCWRIFFLGCLAVLGTGASSATGRADSPAPYLILAPNGVTRMEGHSHHPPPRPAVVPVTRPPYAYGWFGVQPRAHAVRHFGIRQNYIQWSW